MMDLTGIAAVAAPFIAKGAESFSKTAGDRLAGKAAGLFQAVSDRFKGDSYAEQTLARAREMPESEDRQAALKGILVEKMKEDPGFAEEFKKLFDEMRFESLPAYTIFDPRGQNVGTHIILRIVQGFANIGANRRDEDD